MRNSALYFGKLCLEGVGGGARRHEIWPRYGRSTYDAQSAVATHKRLGAIQENNEEGGEAGKKKNKKKANVTKNNKGVSISKTYVALLSRILCPGSDKPNLSF